MLYWKLAHAVVDWNQGKPSDFVRIFSTYIVLDSIPQSPESQTDVHTGGTFGCRPFRFLDARQILIRERKAVPAEPTPPPVSGAMGGMVLARALPFS